MSRTQGAAVHKTPPPSVCDECGTEPALTRAGSDGKYRGEECRKAWRRARDNRWTADNPEKRRNSKFKSRYGITLKQYEAMHEAQGGLCAICKRKESKRRANGDLLPLAVDHDHVTGRARGLLCGACNAGIGHLDDNVERLRAAIDYLNQYSLVEAAA